MNDQDPDESGNDSEEYGTGRGASMSDGMPEQEARPVDPRLLELLICPLTRTRLDYRADTGELWSRAAGLAYPIRNGLPVMLQDEARQLSDDELSRLSR